jgi:hypothetical protein
VEASFGVLEWYSGRCLSHRSGRLSEDEGMGRRLLRSAHGHEEPNGGVVSFGTGVVMGKSSKQKIEHKTFTEAELVGAKHLFASRDMGT